MRFFEILDFRHLVLAVFLGLAAALVIYLSFRGNRRAEGARGAGVPLALIFLYAGIIVWCIMYVIYVGLKGGAL